MQSIRNAEAWLNVNGHGHWNHVHHHAGSCWSGVFFIKYDNKYMSDGDLVLKPVPHSNERNPYTPSKKKQHDCCAMRVIIMTWMYVDFYLFQQ